MEQIVKVSSDKEPGPGGDLKVLMEVRDKIAEL